MLKGLLARHRALRLGAALAGASALAVGFASPAFATQSTGGNTTAKNTYIVQGGSNTTYLMMTSLANLFNEAPGCDLASASGTPQPLDYGCPGINDVGGTLSQGTGAVGENGFTPFGTANPLNDIMIEEPALGSSNGILELEDQGAHGVGNSTPVAPLDSARSSRAPKTSDDSGLNFVAYAMDGVSWFHWTKVGSTSTPSANVKNITTTNLTSIFEDNLSCVKSGKTLTMNWSCLGGTNAPIIPYMAQNGSGTESTWATLLNLQGTFPFGNEATNHVIFENETESIIANKDEKDAIFFFSYGKFKTVCTATKGYCGAKPTGWTGGTIALGEINSVTVSSATIQAQLPGQTGTVFPGDRLLYNVYSDGSNSNIPASTDATLNAVSEDGFLCKPSTLTDIDPNTGVAYHTEISNIVTAQGFFTLPLMVEDGQGSTTYPYSTTASGIPHPAWNELSGSAYDAAVEAAAPYSFPTGDQDTDNSAVTGSGTPTAPMGYCLTVTTDGNSGS